MPLFLTGWDSFLFFKSIVACLEIGSELGDDVVESVVEGSIIHDAVVLV